MALIGRLLACAADERLMRFAFAFRRTMKTFWAIGSYLLGGDIHANLNPMKIIPEI
jgi:hypothetical protein